MKWQIENLEKLCYSYSYAFDIEKNENKNIFQALSNWIKKWLEFELLHALSNNRIFFYDNKFKISNKNWSISWALFYNQGRYFRQKKLLEINLGEKDKTIIYEILTVSTARNNHATSSLP